MLFPTVDFAVFFCLVFLGHWLLNPRPLPWKLFMIGASYVFYAWWDWHFLFLFGFSMIFNFGWSLLVAPDAQPGAADREKLRRRLLGIGIAVNLALNNKVAGLVGRT